MKLAVILVLALAHLAIQHEQDVIPFDPVQSQDKVIASPITQPLTDSITVSVDSDRSLRLEPGVRMAKTDDMLSILTHDGKAVVFEAGNEKFFMTSPANLRITKRGWEIEGKTIAQSSLSARRNIQDDTDSNLKSMEESAKKLKTKLQNGDTTQKKQGQKLRVRWIYAENAFATAELFNSPAIQQLVHCSPNGF